MNTTQLGANGIFSRLDNKHSIASACIEIADITDALGFDVIVGAHVSIFFFRYLNKAPDQTNKNLSQAKLRDLLLACLFLANKSQNIRRWKQLEIILEAAYKTFYAGALFNEQSEEARSWEKRVLAGEDGILSALEFDIYFGLVLIGLQLWLQKLENCHNRLLMLKRLWIWH